MLEQRSADIARSADDRKPPSSSPTSTAPLRTSEPPIRTGMGLTSLFLSTCFLELAFWIAPWLTPKPKEPAACPPRLPQKSDD